MEQSEIMPSVATWVGPEMVILSEVTQIQKDKYYMILLMGGVQKKVKMNLSTKQK